MSARASHKRAGAGVRVREFTSPGGVSAWFVEDHTLPLVSLRFAFPGGAAQDPDGKPGVATMAASLLDEGAGPYESQAFHERLDEFAVELSFQSGGEDTGGALRTLTRHLDEAGELLSLALAQPHFGEDAVERVRSQLLSGLRRESTDADTMATRTFWESAYPNHPYGRPSRGTLESVPTIQRGDLIARHQATTARDNLRLVVVGDIDEKRLGALLDRVFAPLPARAKLLNIAETLMIAPGGVKVVEQDIPQTVVRFGREGIARKDPDFIAAFVVNHVLGGSVMQSRLFTEVREKRGLAYGAYSSLQTFRKAATFLGWTSTKNERVAESLAIIREQVGDLATNGPSEDELDKARKYLIGSYPLRFDASSKIAGELMGLQMEDLGIDYVAKRNDMIAAVSSLDAKRVAHRLFGDGKLFVTLVGKPQGIEATS